MIKTLLIVIIASIAAFAGGVWYAREYAPVALTPPENIRPSGATSTSDGGALPTTTPRVSYQNASADRITVTTPLPGSQTAHTFEVKGKARGSWYFEANFPLEVLSASGTRLVQVPVQATGEWMTTDFVPFTVSVTLPPTYTGAATLVLHNDNASGLPENAASISIPIIVQ